MRGSRYLQDDNTQDDFKKIEKIKRTKRSIRTQKQGDDWLIGLFDVQSLPALLGERYRLGRIIEVQKRGVFLAEEDEHGFPRTNEPWFCSIAKRHFQRAHKERHFVVVGDRVLFEPDASLSFDESGEPLDTDLPRGVIQHGFERTNKIARKDPMNPDWDHVMIANIDVIVIVASILKPMVRWGLIDRLLVQAEKEGIDAIIVLNKHDLLLTGDPGTVKPEFLEAYTQRVATYRQIGYPVFEISALRTKEYRPALRALRDALRGKVAGFSGHSGVGKSSLINLFRPEFEQIVDENPDIFYKGRHTTTYNSLLKLGISAYAIDTPGVRSFSLESMDVQQLSHCFREFRPYTCQFRHCAHDKELSCGVKQAVADGHISPYRYRSYLGILHDLMGLEGRPVDGARGGGYT